MSQILQTPNAPGVVDLNFLGGMQLNRPAAVAADIINRLRGERENVAEVAEPRVRRILDEARDLIAAQQERISYLESLSITDELTGLLNRRGFLDVFERSLAEARRYGETGLIAYIDLDEFKPVNDTYGHEAGDAVLKRVADILKDNVRTTDYAARLGGDEFALLMIRAEHIPARNRVAEISAEINAATIEFDGATLPLRASFGIAPYGPRSTATETLRMADKAMYREKRRSAFPRLIAGD